MCKPDERGRETLLSDVRRRVCGVCQVDEGSEDLLFVVKDRMGGKFLSISMTLTVRAPEIVTLVYDAMGSDQRVKMRF